MVGFLKLHLLDALLRCGCLWQQCMPCAHLFGTVCGAAEVTLLVQAVGLVLRLQPGAQGAVHSGTSAVNADDGAVGHPCSAGLAAVAPSPHLCRAGVVFRQRAAPAAGWHSGLQCCAPSGTGRRRAHARGRCFQLHQSSLDLQACLIHAVMGRPETQGQLASCRMQPSNAGITCQAWPTHGTVLQMRLLGGTNCPAHAWESVGLPLASTHLHGHTCMSCTRPRSRLSQQTLLQHDQEATFAGERGWLLEPVS